MMNYHSLHYFYVCAENLNISKAAQVLGVSQPSLSMQIKSLEDQIGYELFFRNGKSIGLTVKGEELFKTSYKFFDLNDEVERCLDQKDHADKKEMRIGVSDQVERPFVAEIVSNVIKRKKIKTSIFSSDLTEILVKANQDKLDYIISHEKLNLSWSHVIIQYPVFFVTSKKAQSPTFDSSLNVSNLLTYFGEDLIVPTSELKLGKEFEKFRKKNNIQTNIILESNIISCLVRAIADGLGCGFLPAPFLKSVYVEKHINLFGPKEGFWDHAIYIYGNCSKDELSNAPLVKKFQSYKKSNND